MTSGLSRRLEPSGQDAAAVAQLTFLQPFASRPGLGREPGSAARDVPMGSITSPPHTPGRRGDPPSWLLPQALRGSALWVGGQLEGGCPGRGPHFSPGLITSGGNLSSPCFPTTSLSPGGVISTFSGDSCWPGKEVSSFWGRCLPQRG